MGIELSPRRKAQATRKQRRAKKAIPVAGPVKITTADGQVRIVAPMAGTDSFRGRL